MDKIKVKHVLDGKVKHASIREFVIRETDGVDEERAAQFAKAKGGAITLQEELVRLSLVEVDGELVNHDGKPFMAFDGWNTRTRAYALRAWASLNAVSEKEMDDFLAAGEVLVDSPSDAK
jgi:hypothetical protein